MRLWIKAAAEVAETVGDDEIWGAENHVVAGYLVKNGSRDFYRRGFVFNDNEGGSIRAIPDHRVASATKSIEVYADFICHQRGGISEITLQECYKVLPHPFLRRKNHFLAPQGVKHQGISLGVNTQAKFSGG